MIYTYEISKKKKKKRSDQFSTPYKRTLHVCLSPPAPPFHFNFLRFDIASLHFTRDPLNSYFLLLSSGKSTGLVLSLPTPIYTQYPHTTTFHLPTRQLDHHSPAGGWADKKIVSHAPGMISHHVSQVCLCSHNCFFPGAGQDQTHITH